MNVNLGRLRIWDDVRFEKRKCYGFTVYNLGAEVKWGYNLYRAHWMKRKDYGPRMHP